MARVGGGQTPPRWANHPEGGCSTGQFSEESQNEWKKKGNSFILQQKLPSPTSGVVPYTLHTTTPASLHPPASPSVFPVPLHPSALAPAAFAPSPTPLGCCAGSGPHQDSEATRMPPGRSLHGAMVTDQFFLLSCQGY